MRNDLNDLVYFAEVVAQGGFAAAGRALREPKSKLSRRVAGLEARLGVRLIERSSRRFRVTDVGQSFYERCKAMLDAATQQAVEAGMFGAPTMRSQGKLFFGNDRLALLDRFLGGEGPTVYAVKASG